jgi:hypothetical protein
MPLIPIILFLTSGSAAAYLGWKANDVVDAIEDPFTKMSYPAQTTTGSFAESLKYIAIIFALYFAFQIYKGIKN